MGLAAQNGVKNETIDISEPKGFAHNPFSVPTWNWTAENFPRMNDSGEIFLFSYRSNRNGIRKNQNEQKRQVNRLIYLECLYGSS